MVGRRADEGQANGNIHAVVEIKRFHRDQRLIVIHADGNIVGRPRRLVKHGVAGQGAAYIGA